MQTFTQLPQLYQSAANVINPQIRWAGVGFRAAPTPPPGTNSPTAFFWPRTVTIIDGSSGGRVTIADTSWIPGDFKALQFSAQDKGIGSSLYDYWNLWIAEDDDDMLIAPGSSLTAGMQYNSTTGLYTSSDSGTAASNTIEIEGTVTNTPVNISGSLQGGTGPSHGILISNTGSTVSMDVLIASTVVAVIPPDTSLQFNWDPNQVTNIVLVSTATGTTYSAMAYYGP
jgi:hypothetical protein